MAETKSRQSVEFLNVYIQLKFLASELKKGPRRRRVGVKSSVAVRLRARARRGGVDSGLIKLSLKGGIFSLLLPFSSCVREVRGRFGLGEDSGVCQLLADRLGLVS